LALAKGFWQKALLYEKSNVDEIDLNG